MSDVVARQTVPGGGTWLIGSSAGRARSAGWGRGARWGVGGMGAQDWRSALTRHGVGAVGMAAATVGFITVCSGW
jgi:hypothetical protein